MVEYLVKKFPEDKLSSSPVVRADRRYCIRDGSHTTAVSRAASTAQPANSSSFRSRSCGEIPQNRYIPSARIRKSTTI